MALNIPLPDAPPGGFFGGYKAANALTEDSLNNAIKQVQARFAPITTQADAASKLAYANLMGPQFLAKLMGNDAILANLPDSQKQSALATLYKAGTGQGQGTNIFSQSQSGPKGFTDFLMDKMKNIFNGSTQNANPISQTQEPALSSDDQKNILNMQPGDSVVVQGNQNPMQPPAPSSSNNFAQNVGTYKGIEEEGKESGKIRAKDINDLNDIVFNGQTKQATLDQLSNILSSPEFEQIRQVPLAGHTELSYYSKFGTPAQQNMVGQYYTLTGNIIKDSARDFAGQFRRGEQQLLSGMKPNPSDTVDAAKGKTESLYAMNKLLTERARLTSELMSKYHINKLQAEEIADKQVNGDTIRQNIHSKLNPSITIKNKKTGEILTVSREEARKRGVPNV